MATAQLIINAIIIATVVRYSDLATISAVG
ncbi:uncharacterized protein G2W53_043579 [Senna tora]|uniref:Uncharacterized protein n=1 Tax=Senna tora TaxID=362788 RepID=A0A834W026_9FABA|nr:uncharacterized protein G2W53_043579 [Senna tora]